jgi:diguanylate cyclase (GGDEF)-like protein
MAEKGPKKILIVDDSEPIRTSLAAMLSAENYQAVVAENGRMAVEVARKELPDLILCDVQMPELDGYGVLNELRKEGVTAAIPFVFLTGRGEQDQIREGMNLGADDYLTKPFRREELVRTVNARLARRAMIEDRYTTEIRLAEEKLNQLIRYDSLTGLPNQLVLREELHQLLNQKDGIKNVAILLVGLDRFKRVNESLGYAFADILLKFVAERLIAFSAGRFSVARMATDQFVVLLRDSEKQEVESICNAILETIARPFTLETHQVFLTASAGISIYPEHSSEVDRLIKNAEMAMYSAKRQGGNLLQIYQDEHNKVVSRKIDLEAGVRRALENHELLVYYQPQVNLTSGKVVGAEALMRWKHPQEGFIPPSEFIPIMEDSGLIFAAGEWILSEACKQARIWRAKGFSNFRVSVNLSPRQFNEPKLLQRLELILNEVGLLSELLEIELTESSIVKDSVATAKILNELKAMGVRISMDDFGTGYSSLYYFRQFPFDSVKIDQSFIRDVANNSKNAAITLSIIQMAHNLKLNVIAEGVETFTELFFLYLHHCQEMQGYMFSPPLPAEDFGKLLASGKTLQIHRR